MINENWSKWILRTITKHFRTNLSGISVFAEEERKNTDGLDKWIIVRLDIDYNHQQGSHYGILVECDLLVVSTKDNNIYSHRALSGLVASKFSSLSVLNDSAVSQFCLKPSSKVEETYYDTDDNLHQTTVTCTFDAQT